MAPHDGAAQVEERSPLRLPNKIADSDPQKNQRIRRSIKQDVNREVRNIMPCFLQNISILTTLLPPHWRKLPPELKQFVEKEMFDPVLRQVLEDDGVINWAPSATKLYPLITTGDGNCLLHAVSLAMWGIEDDDLFLRNLLHEALMHKDMESRIRWQRERKKQDERIPGSGLRYNTMEWRNEWEIVQKMASAERKPPNTQGLPYESLEEFHVFMLANILRRPIVVMAQSMWRDLQGNSMQPQNFSGVYLPLKWQPNECSKRPLILGYYQMHFVPLVHTGVMEGEPSATESVVPLIHQDHSPLTIHFLKEEEEGHQDQLLQDYLELEEIPHMDINESMASAHVIKGAKLTTNGAPDDMDLMVSYFKLVESHYRYYLEMEYNPQSAVKAVNQQRGDVTSQAEDKISKFNMRSDMWSPASNPNYKSNVPSGNVQQGQSANEPIRSHDVAGNKGMIMSMINQNCKTKSCPYYRSISTGEYCHECWAKFNKVEEEVNASGQSKCRTEGCLNFSEPGQEHCQVCQASAKFQGNVGPVIAPSAPLPSNTLYQSEHAPVVSDNVIGSNQQTARPYQSANISSNSGDDLTTLLVNTQKVGSKKCVMPECQLTGHPTTSDMCQNCFEENRRIHENVMAQSGTAKLEHPPPQIVLQQVPQNTARYTRKCRTQGCPGIGNSHMNGYCAECCIKMSSVVANERSNHPQLNAAAPPSIPPPDYDQALRILQGGAAEAQNTQQSQAAGYADPNQQQNPGFTVQKHICATPGCLGIRLDAGYCWECVRKNKIAVLPPRTQTPPPTPKQSWVKATEPRSQTPPVLPTAATRQVQSSGLGYPRNQAPSTAYRSNQSGNTKTSPLSHPSTHTCRHPKCDRPAAPPKYMLCEECIQIALLYKEDEASGYRGPSSATQPLVPPAAWSGEDTEHLSRGQAMQAQAKPKPSPSKKVPPSTRAYIPRFKCQARGGCKDDMFGDPELNNLCSTCFKESLLKPPFYRPADVHSAPLKPNARIPQRQTSHSQVLPNPYQDPRPRNRVVHVPSNAQATFGDQVVIATGESPAMVQVGQVPCYQKCCTQDCQNPANPNILEGYCNECYHAYVDIFEQPASQAGSVVAQPAQAAQEPHYQQPRRHAQGQTAKTYGYKEKVVDLPTPKPTRIPCKHGWCQNYGNPRCFGYCNECYKLTQLNRMGQIPH